MQRDSILHYNGDSEIRSEISEYEILNNNVLNEQHISEDKKEIIVFLSFNRKDFII